MKNIMKITTGLILAILAGCGAGTNNVSPTPTTELERLLLRVNSNENIVSSLEFTNLESFSTAPQSVSIEDGNGQFIATINGTRYIFSRIDSNTINTVLGNNNLARLDRSSNDQLNPNAPNDYVFFNYSVFDETTNRSSFGFVVTGIKTLPDAIPTTSTASYNGRVAAISYLFPLSDVVSNTRTILGGDINMNVDFSQRTISGRITNIIDPEGIAILPEDGVMDLNETTFRRDGSYNGRLTLSSNLEEALGIQNIFTNNYRGATYGQNANSLVGVFDISGLGIQSRQFRAVGGFLADR